MYSAFFIDSWERACEDAVPALSARSKWWLMKRSRTASDWVQAAHPLRRDDDVAQLLQRLVKDNTAPATPSERWDRLARKIAAYTYLQSLSAQHLTCRAETYRSMMMLSAWSPLSVPIR